MAKTNETAQSGRIYRIGQLIKSNNNYIPLPQQVEVIVCYILESKQCFDSNNTLSSKQILEEYCNLKRKHKEMYDVADSTFTNYLSKCASNNDSPIACQGKKQGYYLQITTPIVEKKLSKTSQNKDTTSVLEDEMYPILTDWLTLKCEVTKDISKIHGRHKWGNPDIIGINQSIFFSNHILEITTIEAKRSLENWRVDIFEAVSHSMFANKVYFAFLCKESIKIPNDILVYAQKFELGLIAIRIPDDLWNSELKLDSTFIQYVHEIIPAPSHDINIHFQKEFLSNLEIRDIDDIKRFATQ